MKQMSISFTSEYVDEAVRRACRDPEFRANLIEQPERTLIEIGVPLQKGQKVIISDMSDGAPPPLVIHLPPIGAELFPTNAYSEAALIDALSCREKEKGGLSHG